MSYSLEEIQKIKAEKERMDAELRLASQIQLSMLPTVTLLRTEKVLTHKTNGLWKQDSRNVPRSLTLS